MLTACSDSGNTPAADVSDTAADTTATVAAVSRRTVTDNEINTDSGTVDNIGNDIGNDNDCCEDCGDDYSDNGVHEHEIELAWYFFPDYTKQPILGETVAQQLHEKGLIVMMRYEYDDDVPADYFIRSDRNPDDAVWENDKVLVVVSLGKE
jgi:hypothetical protein